MRRRPDTPGPTTSACRRENAGVEAGQARGNARPAGRRGLTAKPSRKLTSDVYAQHAFTVSRLNMASRTQLGRLTASHAARARSLHGVLPPLRTTSSRPLLVFRTQLLLDRHFSLEAKAAASFLSDHVDLQQVTPGKISGKVSSALAVLLHADRRPQCLPDGSVRFGPSIQVCAGSDLTPSDSDGLGAGDLGIMKLQLSEPEKVQQRGLEISDEWSQAEAEELLKDFSDKSGLEMSEAGRSEASGILLKLWKLFRECEGICFTLQLDLSEQTSGVKV